ncbi:glycosyltransferase family 2 protein [Dyella sp. EPa41]|uniref:glycosyltransferase family 2 protein n=1 Tax=Dyella sp. EPa41 TaxID=1561194 RepID=UPI0019163DB7|nr:glycosyltransferase family 2 protein [Dyella sp. EPa41]
MSHSDNLAIVGQLAPCELSIVTTLYRSAPYLERFLDACTRAATTMGVAGYEIVCVDDGSPDDSVELLRTLRARHPQVRIIELSRNFGHHQAMIAGMQQAAGDFIYITDCDLEVDPSFLIELWEKRIQQQADVVFGYQEIRKGGTVERTGGGLFWRVFNALSDTRVQEDMVTERLMSRCYVDALLSLGDRNIFLGGMMAWAGYSQIGVPVLKSQRKGVSTYTFAKRLRLLAHAVTSFSAKPLYASLWVGAVALACSAAHAIYIVANKLLHPASTLAGFPSIVAILTAMFGVIMLSLGIIGIYVARIFVQTQGRPIYIIKNIE